MTDLWDFVLTDHPERTLYTDKWSTLFVGALPAFAPSIISAVARVIQNLPFPKFVFGGLGGAAANEYKLFKQAGTYSFGVWRSDVYKIGEPFKVIKIHIPLSAPLAANQEIIPILWFDYEADRSVGTIINTSNYAVGEQVIVLTEDNFAHKVIGVNSFFLELRFTGSALAGVTFPISVEVETIESEN